MVNPLVKSMNVFSSKVGRVVNHTSDSGNSNKFFKYATLLCINALIESGTEYITLRELYETLGAKTSPQKNGVQWGVSEAKADGLIVPTNERAIYQVR